MSSRLNFDCLQNNHHYFSYIKDNSVEPFENIYKDRRSLSELKEGKGNISECESELKYAFLRDFLHGGCKCTIKGMFHEKDICRFAKDRVIEKYQKEQNLSWMDKLNEAFPFRKSTSRVCRFAWNFFLFIPIILAFIHDRFQSYLLNNSFNSSNKHSDKLKNMLEEEFKLNVFLVLYEKLTETFQGDKIKALEFLDILHQGGFEPHMSIMIDKFNTNESERYLLFDDGENASFEVNIDEHLIRLKKNFILSDVLCDEVPQKKADLVFKGKVVFKKTVSGSCVIKNANSSLLPKLPAFCNYPLMEDN